MKTTFLLITLVFLFSLGTGALAQEVEPPEAGLPAVALAKAGLTPDSPFYFLEIVVEEIGTFFTFGDIKKAERYANLATERLAEAQAVVEKDKPELAEKTLKKYENQLNKSIARAEKAMAKGKDFEKVMQVMAKAGNATSKHLEVLAEVYEKVPEQAKSGIENAMTASVKGHEKVVEALKGGNSLGKVPEQAPVSTKIPQEVRERIQKKVQAELTIEETLQGSESLKEFCIKKEGPSEMCEKIPVQGFELFESLENFCIEAGETPELCASLESTCNEYGITIPDECFIFLSSNEIEITPTEQTAPAPEQSQEQFKNQEKSEEKKPEQTKKSDSQNFELIKTKCLEDGGTLEICTSLVNDLQSPKPPRDFCIEIGGPPEACEKIPLSFESLGAIEAYCIESGAPPDQCSALMGRCHEYGVTTPDACFRFLSTAAIITYSHTAPTSVLLEEKTEEEKNQGESGEQSTETREEPRQVYIPGVSKVIIYSTAYCPHCVLAIQWFQENNIEYEEIDISENEIVQEELMEKVGHLVVPITEVENNIMVGFNEEMFSESFGIE